MELTQTSLQSRIINYFPSIAYTVVLTALYLTSLSSYLLFHSLAESFSIIIGSCIFVLAWHSKDRIENNHLLFIGVAFLFVSSLDLLHMLAYKGMSVFPGDSTDLPTQLWIAARYMQNISILVSVFFFRRRSNILRIFGVYAIITAALVASIFTDLFPASYIEGFGLTPFKIASEYIISGILLVAIILIGRDHKLFDNEVRRWIMISLALSMASELAFTTYISVYGFANLIGHFLKIIAFYFIYRAIVEMGLERPHRLLFRNLKLNEATLQNLLQEVQRLADTDSLTGLNNHRHFLELAEHEFQAAIRYRRALSAIMVDVDHFKRINDTCGHLSGDRLLTSVAECFRKETRRVDILGRFGGDEFIILLPETDLAAARLVAENIRLEIARIGVNDEINAVTACLGVATMTGDSATLETLLDSADQALYTAKRGGRNQVAINP